MRIPEISDEKINQLLTRMHPVIERDGIPKSKKRSKV